MLLKLILYHACYAFCPDTVFSFQLATILPPDVSKSNRPIDNLPPRDRPYIGHNAPSIARIMSAPASSLLGSKRKASLKVITRRIHARKDEVAPVDTQHVAGVLIDAVQVI